MKNPSKTIKTWAADDQPREKLWNKGVSSLSDSELIAILLRHGTSRRTAIDVAKDLLERCQNNLEELGKINLHDMQEIPGIGKVKAITIAAALELGRRRTTSKPLQKIQVNNSATIAQYLKTHLKDFTFEVFAVVFLNRANRIKHFEIISKGGITGTVADPRIILKKALDLQACSIVISHNHPSGNLQPSKADIEITAKIKSASQYLDIQLLDHIIVSEDGYYSFADEGMM